MIEFLMRNARKLVIAIIGFTVLFIGILMIVLPGPAIVFIPLGIGILAIEFVWARKILEKIKDSNPFKSKTIPEAEKKEDDSKAA